MKINENCIGCQCCVNNYPEFFEVVDGEIKVKETPENAEEVKEVCPVQAIETE